LGLEERLSRVKLRGQRDGDLETFEALEFLQLGIHGKLALWRALAVAAATDAGIKATDFSHVAGRAEERGKLEQQRLEAARTAFCSARI
jgi:hypothetical protein